MNNVFVKRVYRATRTANDLLGICFAVLGALGVAFGSSIGFSLLAAGWFLILGIGIVVAGRFSRFELTETGISHINVLNRVVADFAWADIQAFRFEGYIRNRNRSGNRFSLLSNGRVMRFYDDIPHWEELFNDIARHVSPQALQCQNVGDSNKKTRLNTIGAAVFITLFTASFVAIAYFSQTLVRHSEKLLRSRDGWLCHYTFRNESRINSVDFLVGRTWLNGVEAVGYPSAITVKPGRDGTMDLLFPLSAATPGSVARLYSWWQWSAGENYSMHPFTAQLTVPR